MVDTKKQNGMYLLTGSQKFELMKGASESLAGRVSIINMLGLSNREIFNDKFNKPFLPTTEYLVNRNSVYEYDLPELWERIHRGSMPKLYDDKSLDWERYYANYVNTYIEKNINQLAQVGNVMTFLQCMTMLASRTGELLNVSSIAQDLSVSAPTVSSWISILERNNIIFLLRPFSLNVNKRIIKTPKIYFTDTGLVCYLCKFIFFTF